MSDVILREDRSAIGPELGAVATFAGSWVQGSGLALSVEEGIRGLQLFGIAGPAAQPGYNPYTDEGMAEFYAQNPGTLHLFRGSRSRGETEMIRTLAVERMARAQRLQDGGGGIAEFVAGMVSPESIAGAFLGVGPLMAASRVGRVAQAARGAAVGGAATEGAAVMLLNRELPTDLQQDLLTSMAWGAVFSGSLGGMAGIFSRRSLDAAADDYTRGGVAAPAAERRPPPGPGAEIELPPPIRFGADAVDLGTPANDLAPRRISLDVFYDGKWTTIGPAVDDIAPILRAADAPSPAPVLMPETMRRMAPANDDAAPVPTIPGLPAWLTVDPLVAPAVARLPDAPPVDAPGRGADPVRIMRVSAPDALTVDMSEAAVAVLGDRWGKAVSQMMGRLSALMPGPDGRPTRLRIRIVLNSDLQHIRDNPDAAPSGADWKRPPLGNATAGQLGYFYKEPDSFTITLNDRDGETSRVAMAQTLSHELGHIVELSAYRAASQETKDAIQEQFRREVAQDPAWAKFFGRELDDASLPGAADITPAFQAYAESFREWFAERTGTWMWTDQAPRNVVEQFFADVAGRIREMLTPLLRELGFETDDALQAWLRETFKGADTARLGSWDEGGEVSLNRLAAPGGPGLPPSQAAPAGTIASTGIGLENIRTGQMPYYMAKNTKFGGALGAAIRAWADEIVQMPGLRMAENADGTASMTASVEALAKQWQVGYADGVNSQDAAYFKHMGWDPANAGAVRARGAQLAQYVTGAGAGKATFGEFDQAVGEAVATGRVPSVRGVALPEALEAAAKWREVYDRFEQEGARSGVLLSAKYKTEGLAHLDQQFKAREQRMAALDARIAALPEDATPLRAAMVQMKGDLLAAQEMTEGRAKALGDMPIDNEPYVPHRWKTKEVRERREDLVTLIADTWRLERADGASWASARVRAEVAVSKLLDETPADATFRAIRAHLMEGGLPANMADAQAEAAVASLRAYQATVLPSRWGVEMRSLLAINDRPKPMQGIAVPVSQALRAAGVTSTNVEVLVGQVVGGGPSRAVDPWSDAARPGFLKERTINLPTKDLAPWLDLAQKDNALDYSRRMGASIETSRKFGDPNMLPRLEAMQIAIFDAIGRGEGSLEEMGLVLQAVRDLRDKAQGIFPAIEDPSAHSVRATRFLVNSAVVTQLGRAIWANIGDVGRIVMAVGFRRTLAGALESAVTNREAWRLGGEEARKAGAALEMETLAGSRAMADLQTAGGELNRAEQFMQTAASQMQYVNLVAPWTAIAQRFAGSMISSDMVEWSVAARDGTLSAANRTKLAQLGIDQGMAARIADEWDAAGGAAQGRRGSLFLANTDAWIDGDLRRGFRAALTTAVDSAVIRPGAADRPLFMSAPLGQMMFLYKGFSISFTQRAIMAGLQQRDAQALSGLMSAVAIAWLVQGASGGAYDKNPILSLERVANAVERAGVMGILGDLNQAVEMVSAHGVGLRPLLGLEAPKFAKDPGWAQRTGAVAGPAISPLLYAVWATTSPDAAADETARAFVRMIPFQNLIWISGGVSALSREVGTAMTSPPERRLSPGAAGFLGGSTR